MSFYKEVPGRKTTLESVLKFDIAPTEGSTNPVTSGGVNTAITEAVGGASDALQEQIDEIAEKAGSGYIPKGEADVATLNGLSGQENGWLYTMTDAGTLTDGSLAVVAGDTVAWDATNSVWYRAMDYAPRQYGTNEVHNLATTATESDLVAGNYLALDGANETKKLDAETLMEATAENALQSIGSLSDAIQSDTEPQNLVVNDSNGSSKIPLDIISSNKFEYLTLSATIDKAFVNASGGLVTGSTGFCIDEFELNGKTGKFIVESGKNLKLSNVCGWRIIKKLPSTTVAYYSTNTAVSQKFVRFIHADTSGYFIQVCRRYNDSPCVVACVAVEENAESSFIATNGNDFGLGTKDDPYKSFNVALKKSSNVFVRGGVYFDSIDLQNTKSCKISGYRNEIAKVVLTSNVWTTAELYSSPVRRIAAPDPQAKFLYQFGVDDALTLIDADKRHGLQGQKIYRCDCTAIRRVSSLAEVTSSTDGYNYHYYADGSYIYFTRPSSINADHFIFSPSDNSALENTDEKIIELYGLRFYGGFVGLYNCKNAIVKNCTAGYGRYGIRCKDSEHITLVGCETLRTEAVNLSDNFGDGISTDATHSETQENDFPIMDLIIDGCWSHDNWQDGFSDHYNSRTTIKNSVFEFNCHGGTGAGITPSYGSGDLIVNCISQFNKAQGIKIEADGSNVHSGVGSMTLIGCVSRFNSSDGVQSNGQNAVECIGCYSYGNGWRGFRTSQALSFVCVDCKAKDNPSGNFSGTMTQVDF